MRRMTTAAALAGLTMAGAAMAQTAGMGNVLNGPTTPPAGMEQMMHGAMGQAGGMDHMMHGSMAEQGMVSEPGQGAFGAIAEIVASLIADPATDWSRVDIDALRAHLVDMNLVTLGARAEAVETDAGLRFEVHGEGAVAGAIQRMVLAHAAAMDGVNGWGLAAEPTADGAVLTVTAPGADRAMVRGLGFFGVLALGMHHQAHHLAMARGDDPHR